MTARDTFRKGQLVRPSAEGIAAHVLQPDDRGTITGFGRVSTLLIWVRKDGRKSIRSYHMKFWEAAR